MRESRWGVEDPQAGDGGVLFTEQDTDITDHTIEVRDFAGRLTRQDGRVTDKQGELNVETLGDVSALTHEERSDEWHVAASGSTGDHVQNHYAETDRTETQHLEQFETFAVALHDQSPTFHDTMQVTGETWTSKLSGDFDTDTNPTVNAHRGSYTGTETGEKTETLTLKSEDGQTGRQNLSKYSERDLRRVERGQYGVVNDSTYDEYTKTITENEDASYDASHQFTIAGDTVTGDAPATDGTLKATYRLVFTTENDGRTYSAENGPAVNNFAVIRLKEGNTVKTEIVDEQQTGTYSGTPTSTGYTNEQGTVRRVESTTLDKEALQDSYDWLESLYTGTTITDPPPVIDIHGTPGASAPVQLVYRNFGSTTTYSFAQEIRTED